ncbi:hypothetical protein [Pontibacter litorisediminis]|uniref:hypothetical protein n=1 Tax=Pontibacter litorisediminis TaxID=1846260 RepID=UPI0023ED4155|nr:hypothetical protein [Pontibacter litorisediminis]
MKKLLILLLFTVFSYTAFCQSNVIGRSKREVIQLLRDNDIAYQIAKDGHITYRLGDMYMYSYFDEKGKCILNKSISGVQSEEDKQWIIQNFCGGSKKSTSGQDIICYSDGCKYTITFKRSDAFKTGWACIIKEELN